jgi:hypothetical protein
MRALFATCAFPCLSGNCVFQGAMRVNARRDRRKSTLCGRLPVGKGFLGASAMLVGAAMCPTYFCGT